MDSIWERAGRVIPGGVNSPVRSFSNVGIEPLFVQSAAGAFLTDIHNRRYLDFIGSWGPMIFGHGYEPVLAKVRERLSLGTSYGLATALEVEFAELLVAAVPSLEMVRLVSSGTEATMSALRLARGYTGRSKIVKFAGCYHGHSNELLVAAGSGALTFGTPQSSGVTAGAVTDTMVLPYNDLAAVETAFARYGPEIAAIIVEPVAANMGLVLPQEGFLPGLRRITSAYGTLLIFDEVITGFRVAYGGAQELYHVTPDLTCLGKIIGGGFPIGAYGGRREIMELISPLGPVYQAGTLSGNPVAVTAGLETLKLLKDRTVYERLEAKGRFLGDGLRDLARRSGVKAEVSNIGSLVGLFFSEHPVTNLAQTEFVDRGLYSKFFQLAFKKQLLFPPSPFETIFISDAHSMADLAKALESLEEVFQKLKV